MDSSRPDAGQSSGRLAGSRLDSLDGLRAIAVLLVIGYHWDVPGFSTGFFGVDMFFALSGFLITSLLMEEFARTGDLSLRRFWTRRIRRLWPESWLLIAISLTGPFVFGLGRGDRTDLSGITALFQIHNWWKIATESNDSAWTGHLWSLSVEEQFYLVWPVIMFLVARAGRVHWRRAVFCATTVLLTCSLTASLLLREAGVSYLRLYFSSDIRASNILIGCLAAIVLQSHRKPVETMRRVVANRFVAVATVIGVVTLSAHGLGVSTAPVATMVGIAVPTLTTVLVAHLYVARCGFPSRILGKRATAKIGRISYGVYLWHFPIGNYLFIHLGRDFKSTILALAVTLVAAELSTRFGRSVGTWLGRPKVRPRRTASRHPSLT